MIKPLKRYQKYSNSRDPGISLDVDFNKNLHFSVWPCGKFDRFLDAINQNPEAIHCRYGFSNETLLHRFLKYSAILLNTNYQNVFFPGLVDMETKKYSTIFWLITRYLQPETKLELLHCIWPVSSKEPGSSR